VKPEPDALTVERAALERDGATVLRGVVGEHTLADLVAALAAVRTSGCATSRQVLYTHRPPPQEAPPLSTIVEQWLNPFRYGGASSTRSAANALRPLAAELLGEAVVLFQDLLLVKKPGQKPFPWHQDFGFWPIDLPLALVFWVPLNAVDETTGGLRFATGSHRLGVEPVVDLHDGRPQDASAVTRFNPDAWPALIPSYRAGDAVAFSPLTFHSSPAMIRDGERPAWSCVFLSHRARWRHANAPRHPLCSVVEDGAPVSEVGDV